MVVHVVHEGTTRVKISRLRVLTSKFETLKIEEDEIITDFNNRLRKLENESFGLGEKMTEETLVRKVLRSLPKRFDMKVTVVEEVQDICSMKVDELIGSLS